MAGSSGFGGTERAGGKGEETDGAGDGSECRPQDERSKAMLNAASLKQLRQQKRWTQVISRSKKAFRCPTYWTVAPLSTALLM